METLTAQELKISRLVAYGLTEKEIAVKLFIAPGTVHAHTRNIRKKTGARNIADITRMYMLSLPEPMTFIKGMPLLVIHLFMFVGLNEIDMQQLKTH